MCSETSRRERWFPLAFLLLAFVVLAPLFSHPLRYADKSDWNHFQAFLEVARRSVVWWHQAPLWNPYGCGGEVLLANPQSEVAAPTFLLSLLFGTALGVKLSLVVYLFCGFDGMYRLSRRLGVQSAGALLSSVLFGMGGWMALHLLVGHTNFASAMLFPYLLLFYSRALDDRYWTIAVGAVAAWIVGLGGTTTPAMAMVLLFTIATIDAIGKRSLLPYGVLVLSTVCATLIGAVRLFPAIEFATVHPRRQWQTDSTTIWQMILNGYRWRSDVKLPGKLYRFHEYGWRLAYLTPPLILWSMTLKRFRRWWIVAGVGAAIAAGAAIPFGPWWMLKHLPIFRDLRVPSRYTVMLALAFPILCGAALCDLQSRLKRGAALLAISVVAVASVDGLAFDWARLREIPLPQKQIASKGDPFYQEQGHWTQTMDLVLANHGVIACSEEAPLQRADKLEIGDVPQLRLSDSAAGTIDGYKWTPNRISAAVSLIQPATFLVNENWNEHWKTTVGEVVKYGNKYAHDDDGGQLAVTLPTGVYRFELYYRPTSFVLGTVVSAVSIPLLLALWIWHRRRVRALNDAERRPTD